MFSVYKEEKWYIEGFNISLKVKQLKIWLSPKPKLKYYAKHQENQGSSKLYCDGKLSFNFSLRQSSQAYSNGCLECLVSLGTRDFSLPLIIFLN